MSVCVIRTMIIAGPRVHALTRLRVRQRNHAADPLPVWKSYMIMTGNLSSPMGLYQTLCIAQFIKNLSVKDMYVFSFDVYFYLGSRHKYQNNYRTNDVFITFSLWFDLPINRRR